jgi:hypothetical protein
MKFMRIRMSDPETHADGFYEIMRRGRIVCLPNDTFIVPTPALQVLDDMGVTYELLNEEGWDSVVRTLRTAAAASAQ